MTVADLAGLLASLFTGMSVLVALVVYRRSEDRATFSRFRLSLVDLRQAVHRLDMLLSEPFFAEISDNIARELTRLLPSTCTPDELVTYMADKQNHDYIAQAI